MFERGGAIVLLRVRRTNPETPSNRAYAGHNPEQASVTGPRFKQRVEAVLEKFNEMRKDLDRERTFMQRQWAKRESQLLGVLSSTTGLHGDLQGIAGQALPEIAALQEPTLELPLASTE
jgi:hypothetical protein